MTLRVGRFVFRVAQRIEGALPAFGFARDAQGAAVQDDLAKTGSIFLWESFHQVLLDFFSGR
jgi:hypothetical protein